MKFPSLSDLAAQTRNVFQRFPVPFLAAVVAAILSVVLNHGVGDQPRTTAVLMAGVLLIPLSLGFHLWSETRERKFSKGLIGLVSAFCAALLYLRFSSVAGNRAFFEVAYLTLAFHLWVAFAMRTRDDESFWQFNRAILMRFVYANIFSLTLYLGCVIILFSIQKLFGFDPGSKVWFDLWFLNSFIVNTLFFLSGVPTREEVEKMRGEYPPLLKKFMQFVLVPLIAVYFVILYAYGAKIAVAASLPNGLISYLVSGVSISGILALLFVYPIQERSENRWIKAYARGFFIAILPLLGLMALALLTRVEEYGVTEKRYILCVLCLWLAVISVYFTVTRSKKIRIIPISLCILAIVTGFGPWSAGSVSRRIQKNRLYELLVEHKALDSSNGQIRKVAQPVSFHHAKELSSILDYMIDHHGVESISEWMPEEVKNQLGQRDARGIRYLRSHVASKPIMDAIGVRYVSSWEMPRQNDANEADVIYHSQEYHPKISSIRGYDYMFVNVQSHMSDAELERMKQDGYTFKITADAIRKIQLYKDGTLVIEAVINDVLRNISARQDKDANLSSDKPKDEPEGVQEVENDQVKMRIRYVQITGSRKVDWIEAAKDPGQVPLESFQVKTFNAQIFWGVK